MGGVAQLASALGHHVTGSDQQVYPPMSTLLKDAGISFTEGFDPEQLQPEPDVVVVGNIMSRGKPVVEALLNSQIPYTSGPQWLYEHLLHERWVIAVSGTHGKTTTASMIAWILEEAGLEPGFLIGGVPENFGCSARVGKSPFFIIEADEYDTAFFDKRSKFVHYHPQTLVINNLEYDHADIFSDLAAIQTQFHHLIRMVPGQGQIIYRKDEVSVEETLAMGCWTPTVTMGDEHSLAEWCYEAVESDYSTIEFYCVTDSGAKESMGVLEWDMIGEHNASNALASILAARHAGVPHSECIRALKTFKGIKRRMECRGVVRGITVYDDFAHHPTAIRTTLAGLRARVSNNLLLNKKQGKQRIIALFEPRSNTMQMGIHAATLGASFTDADKLFMFQPQGIPFNLETHDYPIPTRIMTDIQALAKAVVAEAQSGDHILIMSNGGFGGIHQELLKLLAEKEIVANK